jgi:hypothetical protein
MAGMGIGSAQGWWRHYFYFPPVRLPAPLS